MLQDWVKKEFSADDELAQQRKADLLTEMGLEDRDVKRLQNQMLSAEEAVAAKKEELSSIRTHKGRKANWLAYLDTKARAGYVMDGCEVVRRLKSIIPQLRAYDGRVRGTWGLAAPGKMTFEDGFHPGWIYLGWCYSGRNPEYQIDELDDDFCPTGKSLQGYRTLLLNIIIKKDGTGKWMLKEQGIVQDGTGLPLKMTTEDRVLAAFGYPTNGPTASLYRKALWEFRNGKTLNPVAWT